MSLGNTNLVPHGIQTERSDLRAHVCVNRGVVYVYPTRAAVAILKNTTLRPLPVWSWINGERHQTATGYAVPIPQIPLCTELHATGLISKAQFDEGMSTSEKGDRAVWVVENMLRRGWFSLPINPKFVVDSDMQRQGLDIIVTANFRIEVKCDYAGGYPPSTNPRVTGNLFLQTAECNPLKQY